VDSAGARYHCGWSGRAHPWRGRFLEAVATALQQEQAIGDGVVYRVAMQVQRRFWTPPINEGHHAGKYR
jgi:hypothetical protein